MSIEHFFNILSFYYNYVLSFTFKILLIKFKKFKKCKGCKGCNGFKGCKGCKAFKGGKGCKGCQFSIAKFIFSEGVFSSHHSHSSFGINMLRSSELLQRFVLCVSRVFKASCIQGIFNAL